MNNQDYIDAFKELFLILTNLYGEKWTDGTNADFQNKAREWLPKLKNKFSSSEIQAQIETISNGGALLKHFTIDEYISKFSETKHPEFQNEIDRAIYDVISRSTNDFSAPFSRVILTDSEISERILAFKEAGSALNFDAWDNLIIGYNALLSKGRHREFSPKIIDIIIESKIQSERKEYSEMEFSLVDIYKRIKEKYGQNRFSETEHDFIEHWSNELSLFNLKPHEIVKGFNRAIASSNSIYQVPTPLSVVEGFIETIDDIPKPEDAYQMAVGNKPLNSTIVIKTANEIGSHYLKSTLSKDVKAKFIEIYIKNCISAIKNHEDLIVDNEAAVENTPPVSINERSSRIANMLNKIK